MKGLAICYKGIEEISKQEIIDLIGISPDIKDTALTFVCKSEKDLIKLAYKSHSIIKVIELFDNIKINDDLNKSLSLIKKSIDKVDFSKITENKTFKVNCARFGNHNYSSGDLAPKIGELIINKSKAKVNLTNPDIIFYAYIFNDDFYFGIDYVGFDLSKRDYKVFIHPSSLNSTVAFSLFKIGLDNYEKHIKKSSQPINILDPFSGAGTIPIEAGLYLNNISPNYYKKDKFSFLKLIDFNLEQLDKSKPKMKNVKIAASDHVLRYVTATKNNAKLAGIDKNIDTYRMNIEWLDTKVDEASIDLIITNPPSETKIHDKKSIAKMYKEFFYQTEFIIKKNGLIVICVWKKDTLKENLGKFKIIKEQSIFQGKQELYVLLLKK